MSRPFPSRFTPPQPQYRINGKIRAREVRVIGPDAQQIGVLELGAAIKLALAQGLDLVEIAATAVPPVCRIVDFGKFKYEMAKKENESKKHQHANLVKEVQLTPRIDPHDLGIKLDHAVGFLCEDMKVKVALRFRGREMAHTEIGRAVVNKFLKDLAPWGNPDFPPKLIGKSINVMVSPLPKQKRAKNPKEVGELPSQIHAGDVPPQVEAVRAAAAPRVIQTNAAQPPPSGFGNDALSRVNLPPTEPPRP
ncbi:MAG TPA: translation initiation factor IF-3 [Candidatus Limnocylindria bacterium]|nr:translation initiation factor IF-3 [Candidatus Limnocylindria bacterium]